MVAVLAVGRGSIGRTWREDRLDICTISPKVHYRFDVVQTIFQIHKKNVTTVFFEVIFFE